MGLEDRDFSTLQQDESLREQWNYGINQLLNNERCHLPNNILSCTRVFREDEPKTYFYHCDFQLKERICRCVKLTVFNLKINMF